MQKFLAVVVTIIAIFFGFAIFAAVFYGVPVAKSPIAPAIYEYEIISFDDAKVVTGLNELGKEGWQVVYARRAMRTEYLGERTSLYEFIVMRQKR